MFFAIIFTSIFIIIIILNKACHTVPMLLIATICLTGFLCDIIHVTITIYTLHNDFKQSEYYDRRFYILISYLS